MASYRRKLKECTYQGVGVVNNMEKSLLRKLTALRWQIKSTKEAVRSEMKKKLSLLGIEGDMESSLLGRDVNCLNSGEKINYMRFESGNNGPFQGHHQSFFCDCPCVKKWDNH